MKKSIQQIGILVVLLISGIFVIKAMTSHRQSDIKDNLSRINATLADASTGTVYHVENAKFDADKCGAGKCGASAKKSTSKNDTTKTSGAKCGEGKCGGSDKMKKATSTDKDDSNKKSMDQKEKGKNMDGKCGVGKCG